MGARNSEPFDAGGERATGATVFAGLSLVLITLGAAVGWFLYVSFRVDVPSKHIAVLIHKTGKDLPTDLELAPNAEFKGVQIEPLKEGRTFLNPYAWEWQIVEQVEVPTGHVGVLLRLFGDELPHGELIAHQDNQKGIVPTPLRPGRYPDYSNPFAYKIETHPAVTVHAGFRGVVTLMTGKPPQNPNRLLVDDGERGVQKKVLEPETYYVNPYVQRISLVDCRTKKLDLSEKEDMGFPSKDGFWIRLDGFVQFHIVPDKAAEVFVNYNEEENGDDLDPEIVEKVIMPNARSYCRLAGSSYTARQFIDGTARGEFQKSFQSKMLKACEPYGINIEQASITYIHAPDPITEQLKMREVAKQKLDQYQRQIEQQKSEAKLVSEKMRIAQKKQLIEAEREVIQMKTKAAQEQKVAVTKAEQELSVAKTRLEAAKDRAAALVTKGKAEADVVRLTNEAEVSGLRAMVQAYSGNGFLVAQQVLFEKLAPAYQQLMVNSADSSIMRIFERFQSVPKVSPATPPAAATAASAKTAANEVKGTTP